MVRISDSHSDGPGSIPGRGTFYFGRNEAIFIHEDVNNNIEQRRIAFIFKFIIFSKYYNSYELLNYF